jgi:NAD(P)-dependent dehydrogenase (short-subunit alcohol dehydrogenase family)
MSQHLFDLKGKTFLVTGASSGIGYEVCKTIALMNGNFIAVARREELLKELINHYGSTGSSYLVADLCINEDIAQISNSIDKIDGVIHCAGIVKLMPLKFYNEQLMEDIRKVNYDSILKLMSTLVKNKRLNRRSSIVLVSSVSAVLGMKGNGIYAGLKAALIGISKSWANELANTKTRVNCVAPGMVKTIITEETIKQLSAEIVAEDEKKYPFGYGYPEDVAYPIVFLLSDASKWITGQTIILDGGLSMKV